MYSPGSKCSTRRRKEKVTYVVDSWISTLGGPNQNRDNADPTGSLVANRMQHVLDLTQTPDSLLRQVERIATAVATSGSD